MNNLFLTAARTVCQRRGLCRFVQTINCVNKSNIQRISCQVSHSSTNWLRTESRWMSSDNGDQDLHSKTSLGKLKQLMAIQFTCNVCGRRNSKTFSKVAYTKGIVIIKCDGCKNNHLIADNIGWFKHVKGRNIEEILAEKGEEVKRHLDDGSLEMEIDSKINKDKN